MSDNQSDLLDIEINTLLLSIATLHMRISRKAEPTELSEPAIQKAHAAIKRLVLEKQK